MGDITYLPLADGEFLHLTTVLDCFSRKVVGWSMPTTCAPAWSPTHCRWQPNDPLPSGRRRVPLRPRNAIRIRVFADLCDQLGVTRSMGTVGTSADSAACEGFRASLKRETLQSAHDYGDTCRRTLFAWLTRYNTRRRHSANGHLSPNEYEHRHHTATLTLAA